MHDNGQHCWVSCIYYILKELDMLKMFKSPLTCSAREINIIRKKLKETERYTKFGGRRLKKVFLAKEYLLHLINKCSSSSTASQLHCLHILFSDIQKFGGRRLI
jgi:hypothetical protein